MSTNSYFEDLGPIAGGILSSVGGPESTPGHSLSAAATLVPGGDTEDGVVVRGKKQFLVCLTLRGVGSGEVMSDTLCCGRVARSREKMCWRTDCQVGDHSIQQTLAPPERLSPTDRYIFIGADNESEHRVFTVPYVPAELIEPLFERLQAEDRDLDGLESLFRLLLQGRDVIEAFNGTSPERGPAKRLKFTEFKDESGNIIDDDGEWETASQSSPTLFALAKTAKGNEIGVDRLDGIVGKRPKGAAPIEILTQIHDLQKQVDNLSAKELTGAEKSALADLGKTLQNIHGPDKSLIGFGKALIQASEARMVQRVFQPLSAKVDTMENQLNGGGFSARSAAN